MAQQLKIFQDMLLDGKRNKPRHLIRYHKDFGNDCQNPYILENDKKLPELPTYLKWDEFWDVFSDPSLHNIQKLVKKFGVRTTTRPEINNVHPNIEKQIALKDASDRAVHVICPPYILNIDNVFCSPLYRRKQKDIKAREKKCKKQTI